MWPTTEATRRTEATEAKQRLALSMRDPESVKWGAIWTANGQAYCGFYNAKNAHGAYVGFQPFFVVGDEVFTGDIAIQKFKAQCQSHPPMVVEPGMPGPSVS